MEKMLIVLLLHVLSILALVGWVLILALMTEVSVLCVGLFVLYWPLARLMRYLEKKYWRFW